VKTFTRVEPTEIQSVGDRFKRQAVIKHFQTEDGLSHEFTTWGAEGSRAGAAIASTRDNQVVITYQFRGGPERWMYDIPGGGIDDGEDPQVGVLRELLEETGYQPGSVEFLGTSCRDSINNTTWYYYLALACVPSTDGRQLDDVERDQGAEVRLISIAELIKNAKQDQMTDPHAVLMAYDRLMDLMKEKNND
jgi:ADP-ribose pyrophosphatase